MRTNFNGNKSEKLILDAAELDAERTSSTVPATGFNTVTLHADYTRGTGTDVNFEIDQSDDGGVTWRSTTIGAKTGGTVEVTPLVLTETGTTDWALTFPSVRINCDAIRVRVNSTLGTDADVISANVTLTSEDSAAVV